MSIHTVCCMKSVIKLCLLSDGKTPLHNAAQNGNINAVNALLAAGANVQVKDK